MESVGLLRSSSTRSSCNYLPFIQVIEFYDGLFNNFPKSFVLVGAPCIFALFPKLCMVEATIATFFEQNLNENCPSCIC